MKFYVKQNHEEELLQCLYVFFQSEASLIVAALQMPSNNKSQQECFETPTMWDISMKFHWKIDSYRSELHIEHVHYDVDGPQHENDEHNQSQFLTHLNAFSAEFRSENMFEFVTVEFPIKKKRFKRWGIKIVHWLVSTYQMRVECRRAFQVWKVQEMLCLSYLWISVEDRWWCPIYTPLLQIRT